MKILVLGINGMAGHMIGKYLGAVGHEVIGFARKQGGFQPTLIGDALNKNDIVKVLSMDQYDAVVNAIGILNKAVDANLEEGIYINSVFPHVLAGLLEDKPTKLIHISSDCIFSGEEGQYKEHCLPDNPTYYGKTKVLGEINDHKNLTFRTSIVGPEIKEKGIGLLHWFLKQTGSVNGFTKVIWSGVTSLELAKAINQGIAQNIVGVYHLVNNEGISKYDLLQLFNQYIRSHKVEIMKEEATINDKTLINTRTEFDYIVPGYQIMVEELAEWMAEYPELYQQYKG